MRIILTTVLVLASTILGWSQKAVRYFEAQRISDQRIQLNWITSAGLTCPDLFIERSNDLSNFEEVYRHSGVCGSTFEEISYYWVDEDALPGISYYRIQESFGQHRDTIEVFNPSGNAEVFMFPNPASDVINIYRNDEGVEKASLIVFSLDGKLILQTDIENQTKFIDISQLGDGLYYFQYTISTGIVTRKILISKNQNR
jgi:Secretion system C-terminal sorting domain